MNIKKVFEKIDGIFWKLRFISSIFFGFMMVTLYTEFVVPKLGWMNWFLSPFSIIFIFSLMWFLGCRDQFYKDFVKK